MQMRRGKDWEGLMTCRRKSGDVIHLPSKVSPVITNSRLAYDNYKILQIKK